MTQVYDSSCTIYVYFGFNYEGLADPVKVYEEAENEGRDEILKCGGSLSHHHGIGKIRKEFAPKTIGKLGIEML